MRFEYAPVHRRMFNQTWRWAGQARRSDKNIGVSWVEIPARLRQMVGDVRLHLTIYCS
jgi:fido (protein-threonine AMPylation protein)